MATKDDTFELESSMSKAREDQATLSSEFTDCGVSTDIQQSEVSHIQHSKPEAMVPMESNINDTKCTESTHCAQCMKLQQTVKQLQDELVERERELSDTKSRLAKTERQLQKATEISDKLLLKMNRLSSERIEMKMGKAAKPTETSTTTVGSDNTEAVSDVPGDDNISAAITEDAKDAVSYPDTEKSASQSAAVSQITSTTTTTTTIASATSTTTAGVNTAEQTTLSLADELKSAAQAVCDQQGYVYDERTGLYYDYSSGYYYDHQQSLFFDPVSGTYFYYDAEAHEYKFHSQVDVNQLHAEQVRNYRARAKQRLADSRDSRQGAAAYGQDSRRYNNRQWQTDDAEKSSALDQSYSNGDQNHENRRRRRRRKRRHIDEEVDDDNHRPKRSRRRRRKSKSRRKIENENEFEEKRPRRRRHKKKRKCDNGEEDISRGEKSNGTKSRRKRGKKGRKVNKKTVIDKESDTLTNDDVRLLAEMETDLVIDEELDQPEAAEQIVDQSEPADCDMETENDLDREEGELSDADRLSSVSSASLATPSSLDSESEGSESYYSGSESGSDFESEDEFECEETEATGKTALDEWEEFCSQSYAPCIRCMVTNIDTDNEKLPPVGSLIIVTQTGATIGREQGLGHLLVLPDLLVSKMHLEISYDSELKKYTATDYASQNGTLINRTRLGESKVKSQPKVLQHLDVIKLGSTELTLHIHPGKETCDDCEPGLVQAQLQAQQKLNEPVLSKSELEAARRKQVKQMKKKFGLEKEREVALAEGYTDKAAERRQTKGSDAPYQKEAPGASVHRAISAENKGHKLLTKMGWSDGQSLGKSQDGIKEPINVLVRGSAVSGLGSGADSMTSLDATNQQRQHLQRKMQTQMRYASLDKPSMGQTLKNARASTSGFVTAVDQEEVNQNPEENNERS